MALLSLEWMVDDAQRLAECRHDHPFAVLGPQPLEGGGWVVRAWMPEAEQVDLSERRPAWPMATPHHPWMFEAELAARSRLQLSAAGAAGRHRARAAHDPWAFRQEWMGELDRHLFAEGNHHHIWHRMGAHPGERDGVAGVHVLPLGAQCPQRGGAGRLQQLGWSPSPDAVAAGGLLGTVHPRARTTGEIYKYEMRTQAGHCYQKADPYGFRHEVRPNTGSMVAGLGSYPWSDGDWMDQRDSRNPLDPADRGVRDAPGQLDARRRRSALHRSRWQRPPAGAGGRSEAGCAAAHLPGTGRQGDPLREGPGLHPHRADARLRASLRWLLGLSGDRLVRPHQPLRQPG